MRKTNVKRDKILHSEKDTFKEKLLVGYRCLVIFGFNNTKNALSFFKAESLLHTENVKKLTRCEFLETDHGFQFISDQERILRKKD